MATLIAAANGNLTAAATWGVVNATGATFLNSQAANTALTTALVASAAFTPGAITIDGIAVKLASRAASPSGTMDIELATGGVQVAGTSVTINVADLPLCTTSSADLAGGWMFFKFAAPVLLVAATAYTVRAKTSVATQVNLFRDATAGNWSRALRTTTAAAPGAGDDMIVVGEKTAAGAMTTRTVTMDSVAATDYGSNVTGANGLVAPALAIGQGGTLTFGTTAATNYILRLSGNLIVYAGGAFNGGTVATPIPRAGTAELQFDCAADGDFGFTARNLSTIVIQALSRTAGKDVWMCRLNTDEAVNSTSLGVDTDTGWLDNDRIAVATTTDTIGQGESGLLNGAAGASSLTVDGFAGAGGGLAFAHLGTAPLLAEVLLLTRSFVIRAVTAGLCSFMAVRPNASADLDWVEFTNMGTSTAAALLIETTTGSCSARYLAFHTGDGTAVNVANGHDNVTVQHVATYNCPGAIAAEAVTVAGSGGANTLFSDIFCTKNVGGGSALISFNSLAGVIEDITGVGGLIAISLDVNPGDQGSVTRLLARCASQGIQISNGHYARVSLSDFSAIRNTGVGIDSAMYSGEIDTVFCQGNAGTSTASISARGWLKIKDYTSDKDTLNATGFALSMSDGYAQIDGGALGMTSAHDGGAITQGSAGTAVIVLNNVEVGDAVLATNMDNWALGARVSFTRMDLDDTLNLTITHAGKVERDAAVFHAVAPSQKLTPSSADVRLASGPALVACNDGATKTVQVQVRKDGSYAGSAPRLVLKANAAMGVNQDTVLDTLSVGAATWELLSGTTPTALMDGGFELVVDCDGVAGAVNVDAWAVAA